MKSRQSLALRSMWLNPFALGGNASAVDQPVEVPLAALLDSRSSISARSHIITTCVGWGLALVLASLPFELYAGVPLAGLTFTNVEILVVGVLALWALSLLIERRRPRLPRGLLLPALTLLAIFLISAAIAPEWRGPALKFSARQIQAALLGSCLADQIAVGGWPSARRLGLALLAGAAISATLGLLEISESPAVLALLAAFKDQPTMAGGLLRLSATFGYANIAAMFYEATLPICLAAVGLAASRTARWVLTGAALLLLVATLLTYSRAALLTAVLATLVIMLGALALGRRVPVQRHTAQPHSILSTPAGRIEGCDSPKPHPSIRASAPLRRRSSTTQDARWRAFYKYCSVLLAPMVIPPCATGQSARRVVWLGTALLALTAAVLLLSPTFRVRLAAPDVADWYRADYSVGQLPAMAPNQLISTPVTIQNRGLVTWRSSGLRPVALSYHWLDPHTRRVVRYNGRRTLLPQPVEPGAALLVHADIQAPDKPGAYLLAWDMVVEHSGWFSERGNRMAELLVTVAGQPAASQPAPGAEPASMPQLITVRPAPPARSLLWGAAVRIWRARPLLGIGPDVFRHIYGPELGLAIWDDRVHTNSLYLELLVGSGVVGLAAFLLLIALAIGRAVRVLTTTDDRRPTTGGQRQRWVALGCAVALLAFLIHGVLDMFLEYSATSLLLWALIGALGSLAALEVHQDIEQKQIQ